LLSTRKKNISKQNHQGLIVAGMQSSSGKTLVMSLVLSALCERQLSIQPFKIGPDYIDPGYHFHFSKIKSINLDPWIMGNKIVLKTACQYTENAFGVAEGVMGLFDGSDPESNSGSTMEVAKLLSWPIILVVPCRNVGRSIKAAINGFISEAGGKKYFVGIILNEVNSENHAKYLRKSCDSLPIPILGVLPEITEIRWPERYLGLQPQIELNLPKSNYLSELAEKYFDFNLLLKNFLIPKINKKVTNRKFPKFSKRIAVAQDQAFHFYYAANLEWLYEQGVEIIPFSPINDIKIPENVDALILGGGFPEIFAEKISANKSMLSSLKQAIESDMPCYAECGGLMILAEGLKLQSGQIFSLAGVIPGTIEMKKILQNFGYCKITLPESDEIRGHEFHYSSWSEEMQRANLWEVVRNSTGVSRKEGYRTLGLHASYVHLYFPQAANLIREILNLSQSDNLK